MSIDVFFEGLEQIAGLTSVLDRNNEVLYHHVVGATPIVIVACHSGTPDSTPTGAQVFGQRTGNAGSDPSLTDDTNTLKIALATIRALQALGAPPHAFVNRISRKFVDHNRSWTGQLGWNGSFGVVRPGDETVAVAHSVQLAAFKQDYYDPFQQSVDAACRLVHPDGWLFDLHGMSIAPNTVVTFTGYGHYARQDVAYGGSDNLHAALADQGFALNPANADAAAEIRNANTGGAISNFMSGSLHGARAFRPASDPVPFAGNVVPTEPQRVHGVQLELDRTLRFGRSDEELEEVGLRLGTAIHRAMMGGSVIRRVPAPKDGRFAREWYATLASA